MGTDTKKDESDSAESQVERYHSFHIDIPFTDHPFTALKSHNIQFGLAIGIMLGIAAMSSTTISIAQFTIDALGLTALIGLSLIIWSMGLDLPGPVGSAEASEDVVGNIQLREKPHYFSTPLALSYFAIVTSAHIVAYLHAVILRGGWL